MGYQISRRDLIGGSVIMATPLAAALKESTRVGSDDLSQDNSLSSLWDRLMVPFLGDPQWHEDYAYDAGNALMVPLHAAYSSLTQAQWVEDFERHAARLLSAIRAGTLLPVNRIALQQYLYVFSQQAVLQLRSGIGDRVNLALINNISDIQARLWAREPAPQWDRDPFDNMRSRLIWKYELTEPRYSYYRAIIDEEFFNFAIAADLCTIFGDDASEEAREAVAFADMIFEREGVFSDDGWLFQPGVWWEHRDFAYAGRTVPDPNMTPSPVPGIASDTNHAHRLPLWMQSLRECGGPPLRTELYNKILLGLEKQFMECALVSPSDESVDGFKTTNYLDGRNGIYRWEYETQGENRGYLPYQLSGTLCFGWWAFLNGNRVSDMYSSFTTTFPLQADVVETYTGPNTTRTRHPLVRQPEFFQNGFAELIVRLTGHLSRG